MTPANRAAFRRMAESIRTLADENPDSSTCLFRIIEYTRTLMQLASDFHFRPEANDSRPKRLR